MKNVQIILVEPVYPGNVGAIARSASNYGVNTIKIVGDLDILVLEAKKMALYGFELLQSAARFKTIEDAIADCHCVIGTVHQARYHREKPRLLWHVFDDFQGRLPQENIGLVFGREDNGLTREELNCCHYLATIPTPENMSFNLAHSVTVCLYELSKTILGEPPADEPARPNHAAWESYFSLSRNALEQLEFFQGSIEDSSMTIFRDLMYRLNPTTSDIEFLKAIIYKILKLAKRVPPRQNEFQSEYGVN